MQKFVQFFAQIDYTGLPSPHADAAHLKAIYNIVLGVMGAVTVLIIVIAGFRYILSQGSPQEVASAKNTILYSLAGLVVIAAAFAIVNFVIKGVR
jgi:hypothetical protein